MNIVRFASALAFMLTLLAGCATPQEVQNRENILAGAGFNTRPADTPQRLAMLRTLPSHRFVHQVRNGHDVWIYADPTICRCLYVGSEQAWQAYRAKMFQSRAEEQAAIAQSLVNPFEFGTF